MDLYRRYIDVICISDNVAGMMYRPTSSGLLVPTSYQFGSNQIFQVMTFTLYRCTFAAHMQTLTIRLSEKHENIKSNMMANEMD